MMNVYVLLIRNIYRFLQLSIYRGPFNSLYWLFPKDVTGRNLLTLLTIFWFFTRFRSISMFIFLDDLCVIIFRLG